MADSRYANVVGVRVGAQDIALLVAQRIEAPSQFTEREADEVVYMSPATAKQAAESLMKAVAFYEEITGASVPAIIPDTVNAKMRKYAEENPSVRLHLPGDADGNA